MKRLTVFLMVFFTVVMVQDSSNATVDVYTATLEGVKSFSVVVEGLSEDAKRMGLSMELIQSKVELQLQKNGLPIVDQETKFENYGKLGDGCETLIVRITVVKVDSFIAYNISLEFSQSVKLERNDAWFPGGKTWYSGGIELMRSGHGKKKVIEYLLDHVDIFSNDFLSVNDIEE